MKLIIFLYLVNFFRTFVVILIIYFLFKIFNRYVLPLILENKIRQMQDNINDLNRRQKQPARHEGDVTIDYNNQQPDTNRKQNEGEYIDFEEVD